MNKNIFFKKVIKRRRGFTLIEILIIIIIIGILASAILVSINQSSKNARINSAKTSLRSVLPAIIACKDGGGNVNNPSGETDICASAVGLSSSKWPTLSYGYVYVAGGIYNSANCSFQVSTNGDTASNLACSCASQICQ